ncbi:hypothetical protein A0J48_009995 [Sphaerospermopsis aphanizomenoides BCCUSP55]|uniref:hypothetical protein n=1 Tax=Sphaerospermopsis aphanizomenoides TaxID=459663 RepID=UPI001F2BC443|nr:hypothetical protein [Sphaerospermopsis aphanizomenoides]MBK1987866.1 hypothetical protein [Sphaerospermopsis aphanizomenoides BCCUSP55]
MSTTSRRSDFSPRELNSYQYLPIKPNNIKEENPQTYDSLIAKSWQKEQYIGIAILLVSLIAIIGFFSRRFEYALIFALTLSIILIVFFITV